MFDEAKKRKSWKHRVIDDDEEDENKEDEEK